jgi:hypothetical protein
LDLQRVLRTPVQEAGTRRAQNILISTGLSVTGLLAAAEVVVKRAAERGTI